MQNYKNETGVTKLVNEKPKLWNCQFVSWLIISVFIHYLLFDVSSLKSCGCSWLK